MKRILALFFALIMLFVNIPVSRAAGISKEFSLGVLCQSCSMLPVERELEFEVKNLANNEVELFTTVHGSGKITLEKDMSYQISLKKNKEFVLEPFNIQVAEINGELVILKENKEVLDKIIVSKIDFANEVVQNVCDFSDKMVTMAPIPLMVEENGSKRQLRADEEIIFNLYNTSRSERVGEVKSVNGEIPALSVYEHDDYILFTSPKNKDFILADMPFAIEMSEFYFKQNGEGKLPIRNKTKNLYAQPANIYIDSLTVRHLEEDEVVYEKYNINYVRIKQDKENPKDYSKIKLIFTSEFDTVTATPTVEDEWGVNITPIDLYEGVQYSVRVEDPNNEFAIANFPFTLVDKSERGPNHPLGWQDGKYVFNHSFCSNSTWITLVPKGTENDKNTVVKSEDGTTTIAGMNFGNLMLRTIYPNKSSISSMKGKDFDLIRYKLINPNRCEVTKMAEGDFIITKNLQPGKTVNDVYQLGKEGKLEKLDFKQKDNTLEINTKTLSIYDIVIEYEMAEDEKPITATKPNPENNNKPVVKEKVNDFKDIYKLDKIKRISGKDRYETAVELSKAYYKNAKNVVITSGVEHVDSLTSSPLASILNGPILLTTKDKLNEATLKELKRLGCENITIVGGESTISKEVQNELEKTYKVSRISGLDRYKTAIEVGNKLLEKVGNKNKIVLTNGNNLVDALAGNSIAAKEKLPILLTGAEKLNDFTKEALKKWEVKDVIIVGGKASVSSDVENELIEMGIEVKRLAGNDRFETAVEVAKYVYPNANKIMLANGYNYVDALVAGPITVLNNSPIILTPKDTMTDSVKSYINNSSIKEIEIIGGSASIAE